MPREIVLADSVTRLPAVTGKVLVAGSHAGVIAAYLGAAAGAHALVLNDAGVGLERAGIAGLPWLEAIGMAACAVDCMSARIGDGEDMLRRGVVSHANLYAARVGVAAGQSCQEAAERLRLADPRRAAPPAYGEGRFRLADGPPQVWALDSLGKVVPEDAGRVLFIGSHGALLGGRPEGSLPVAAAGAVFNDAGVGADRIGISHLQVLQSRGIPAAAVDCMSARIGDGRSMWATGALSFANPLAHALGARRGMRARAFAQRLLQRKNG